MGLAGKALQVGTAAAVFGGTTVAGSFAGAAIAGNTPGSNIAEGSMIGTAAGVTIGAVGAAATMLPKQTGKLALGAAAGLGKASIGAAELAGGAALKAAEISGVVAMKGAGLAGEVGVTAVRKYGGAASSIAGKLVKPVSSDATTNLLGHKASGLGIVAWAGAKTVDSFSSGFREINRNRMGQIDSNITRATPRTPAYAQNAGATGDLVFAMNNNRRG